MSKASAFLSRYRWLLPIAAFAANLSILWMINFVPVCTEAGVLPRLCEATRPWASLRPILMITLAVSFPAMIVLLGLLRTARVRMCWLYAAVTGGGLLVAFVLYRLGYFVPEVSPGSNTAGCLICNVMFMLLIAFNLGWIFAAVPAGLINHYASMLHRHQK